MRSTRRAPLQASAGSGSESEDEGLDDEAMFRMDAKLAAYFAAAQESKRGERAQRDELLNFKMRVLGLLEAYIKKVGWQRLKSAGARKRAVDRRCRCGIGWGVGPAGRGCGSLSALSLPGVVASFSVVFARCPKRLVTQGSPSSSEVFQRAQVPGSPLLPSAVLPLLAALAASGGAGGGVQQGLAERLAGLVQNKLCKSKPEASGVWGAGPMARECMADGACSCLLPPAYLPLLLRGS